jgi:Fe2+ transport system protein FeoA
MIDLNTSTDLQLSGMPLAMAPVGQAMRLLAIDAGQRLTHRLTELGLTPGVELMIVQDSGGPLLLAVRDSRVAVGRGMAHKMRVEQI